MRTGVEWTQVDEGSKGAGLEKERHGQKAQCGAKYLPSCHEALPVFQGTPPRRIISKSKSLRRGCPWALTPKVSQTQTPHPSMLGEIPGTLTSH